MKKPQLKLRLKAALHEALPGVARGLFCVHWTPPTGNLAKYLRTWLRLPGRLEITDWI